MNWYAHLSGTLHVPITSVTLHFQENKAYFLIYNLSTVYVIEKYHERDSYLRGKVGIGMNDGMVSGIILYMLCH